MNNRQSHTHPSHPSHAADVELFDPTSTQVIELALQGLGRLALATPPMRPTTPPAPMLPPRAATASPQLFALPASVGRNAPIGTQVLPNNHSASAGAISRMDAGVEQVPAPIGLLISAAQRAAVVSGALLNNPACSETPVESGIAQGRSLFFQV